MNTPKRGDIYRHFKHDPNGENNNHTYEIVGTSYHSETGEVLVIYKPLYSLNILKENNCDYMARPLSMFMENVDRDGYKGPRFIRVSE